MNSNQDIAVIEPPPAPANPADLAAQQLIAIEPQRYVSLVFASVAEKLAQYKREAEAVTFDVTTAAGMKTAIEWRAKFRDEIRIATENARKERKAPILEIGRLLDGRAKEITTEALPYEAKFDDAIKAYEAQKAAEKKARDEAERARVQAHQTRLAKLAALPEVYTSTLPPDRLMAVIQQLEQPPAADYEEFAEQAAALRQAALVALRAAHVEALERIEREEAARAAEAARLAQEAADRAAAEERQRQEREAEDRRRAEEQGRLEAERAERERQDAERRAAEEARIAEERRQLEAEQAEQRRIAAHRERLSNHRAPMHLTATDSPALIKQTIQTLTERVVDESYEEFQEEASQIRAAELERLSILLAASEAHKAEQERIAAERAELERQQREQAEREAEIERKEREAREAQEARQAAARAEEERRQSAERERQEADRRRAALRKRVSTFTARDIAQLVAEETDVDLSMIASRIAEIPHEDWVALAVGEQEAAA